ncbi:hypothetical protein DLR73_03075 [Vibrio paracholerae]|nr:hypothetical protein DLR73_03075 [Vibrio paracholerae]
MFSKNTCQCEADLYNAPSLTQQGLTAKSMPQQAKKEN